MMKLSPYHKIFYNEWKIDSLSNKYNIVFDQIISNDLSIERLEYAIINFINDYILLNSHVIKINDDYLWEINSNINSLHHFKTYTQQMIYSFVTSPFDLESGPLYRFAIYNEIDGNYRLVIVLHHIVIDGNSFDEFIENISAYYNYSNYRLKLSIFDQKKLINQKVKLLYKRIDSISTSSRDFWNSTLTDAEPVDLRFLKSSSIINSKKKYNIKEINFEFEEETVKKIEFVKKQFGISGYTYSLLVFTVLINRYTSQNKFAISFPNMIKDFSGLLYGSSINANIYVSIFNKDTTILDLIIQYKKYVKDIIAGSYNYYPIDKILDKKDINFLDVFFAQTNLKKHKFNFYNASSLQINKEFNFDLPVKLLFEYNISQNRVCYRIKYSEVYIDELILKNFINHYKKLFFDILSDIHPKIHDKKISQYEIISYEEYKLITHEWNQTYKSWDRSENISQLFEEQASNNPNNIAIYHKDVSITYFDLDVWSNQFAYYLQKKYNNALVNTPIIVYMERSINLIVSILAIVKINAIYVPINSMDPIERISYIVKDTKSKLIITKKSFFTNLNQFKHCNIEFLIPKQDDVKINYKKSKKHGTLAYIMYTSGTTGKPKGVVIKQTGIITLVKKVNYIDINNTDTILHLSNIAFDASTFEIWGALLNGAKLCIIDEYDESIADSLKFKQYIIKHNVSILWLTKCLFDDLYVQDNSLFRSLKYLLIGGEALNYHLIYELVNSKNKPLNVINGYGPTENTTFSCTINLTSEILSKHKTIPIGTPISNRTAYILNENYNVLPLGAIGELYVGGTGIAHEYLNQIELTKNKIIDNIFQINNKNLKLYKTGDIVRYLSDGNIEYLGRKDNQIKNMGYRIELFEIESALLSYGKMKQVAVLLKENKYLIAYYTADYKLNETEILDHLNIYLPMYMIPNSFHYIESMPRTISGKLNYNLLSKIIDSKSDKKIHPQNSIEEFICKLYIEILQLKHQIVGRDDNFFLLGGNSISAIRLVSRLQHSSYKINVNDIFMLKSPKNIAKAIIFTEGYMQHQLNKVKLMHIKLKNFSLYNKLDMQKKYQNYSNKINDLSFVSQLKKIKYVLLTGSTGYLGCNILFQLLTNTKYKIYLLIRASTDEEAYSKLQHKFNFYFNNQISKHKHRLIIKASDLESHNLKISIEYYRELAKNVDSIIHCAALVKHYGDNDKFYSANVQATVNLLELCKLTKLKDFHYISTISIFTDGYVPNHNYYLFTEYDNNDVLVEKNHIYSQTKYQGELETIKYRKLGINSNIYRVGNLAMNSTNYSSQENMEENAFFTRIKLMLKLKLIPIELSKVEISPVDWTALAITKIFDQSFLSNGIHHVFNPYKTNLLQIENFNIISTNLNDFINHISKHIKEHQNEELVKLYMLHQKWLQDIDLNKLTLIDIIGEKTNKILDKLDFNWEKVSEDMLNKFINQYFLDGV